MQKLTHTSSQNLAGLNFSNRTIIKGVTAQKLKQSLLWTVLKCTISRGNLKNFLSEAPQTPQIAISAYKWAPSARPLPGPLSLDPTGGLKCPPDSYPRLACQADFHAFNPLCKRLTRTSSQNLAGLCAAQYTVFLIQQDSIVVRSLDTSIDRPRLGQGERESVRELNPK